MYNMKLGTYYFLFFFQQDWENAIQFRWRHCIRGLLWITPIPRIPLCWITWSITATCCDQEQKCHLSWIEQKSHVGCEYGRRKGGKSPIWFWNLIFSY